MRVAIRATMASNKLKKAISAAPAASTFRAEAVAATAVVAVVGETATGAAGTGAVV